MKKYITAFTLAMAMFTFQACHKIYGEGPIITKTSSQYIFTAINSSISGEVYYTQDSICKVEIHAQANILDQIETNVVDNELQIQFKKFGKVGYHDRITIYVSSPNVTGLSVTGSGRLFATQPLNAASMALRVNGSGTIQISKYTGTSVSADISGSGEIDINDGEVKTESLHISGSGGLSLSGLVADEVTANTSGSGNMYVHATRTLSVTISGSGNVFYSGYPAVFSSTSGSGNVSHL